MMAIFIAICSILVLVPPAMSDISPTIDEPNKNLGRSAISESNSNPKTQNKRGIWDYLNPFLADNQSDESESEESDELNADVADVPKITIWEFPTQRRVFIGDQEIFVHSIESDDNESHESYFLNNVPIVHPHKRKFHDFTNDVNEDKNLPIFKMGLDDKDSQDAEDVVKFQSGKDANGFNDFLNFLSTFGRGKRSVDDKAKYYKNYFINTDDKVESDEPDTNQENLGLYGYLAYLYDYIYGEPDVSLGVVKIITNTTDVTPKLINEVSLKEDEEQSNKKNTLPINVGPSKEGVEQSNKKNILNSVKPSKILNVLTEKQSPNEDKENVDKVKGNVDNNKTNSENKNVLQPIPDSQVDDLLDDYFRIDVRKRDTEYDEPSSVSDHDDDDILQQEYDVDFNVDLQMLMQAFSKTLGSKQ